MFKAIHAFFTGLGIIGLLAYIALLILMAVGYIINIVDLVKHLPTIDAELVLRMVGVFVYPLGALFGWFL